MPNWREAWDWVGYGALGPVLAFEGLAGIYNGLTVLHRSVTFNGKILAMAPTIAGGLAIAIGIVLTVRPRTNYWLGIVACVLLPAAVTLKDTLIYGPSVASRVSEIVLWLMVGCLLALYAHHCHWPYYAQTASDQSDSSHL